jgi:predicted ATP-dependent Lon-type protease
MCFGGAVQSCELQLSQEFQKAVPIYLLTFLKAIYVCITQSCIDKGKTNLIL